MPDQISLFDKKFMPALLPRFLYISAIICAAILVWPDPITVFLAGCFSCLTLPIYRRLRIASLRWKKRLGSKAAHTRTDRALARLADIMPLLAYTIFVLGSFLIPLVALIMLVLPQVTIGLQKLQQLRASNIQIPPQWTEYVHHLRRSLEKHPFLEKGLNDALDKLDSMLGDTVGFLLSQSVSFVSGTMNIIWLAFLFLMLTIPFTQYARKIRMVCSRALRMPHLMLGRFITAIHKALKAILLGIILVAAIQGALCGIGFYFAGISQPAFWGLLATVVAPIPAIGTALVWFPLCVALWFTDNTIAAIGLALWGALFVSNLDSALRPFFLQRGIKAPFFVLILSILCGLSSLGAVGLIAGPVLLAIAMQALDEANHYYGQDS